MHSRLNILLNSGRRGFGFGSDGGIYHGIALVGDVAACVVRARMLFGWLCVMRLLSPMMVARCRREVLNLKTVFLNSIP